MEISGGTGGSGGSGGSGGWLVSGDRQDKERGISPQVCTSVFLI
jgi:hypothetical protein